MTPQHIRQAATLMGVFAMVLSTFSPLQSVFGEGGARRDIVRQEQIVKNALEHALEAVNHGKQNHAEQLVTHAEASLLQALRGGTNPHVAEAITNLNEAIEHGKAGHADVATKHAESAITHLSQVK
ncbi:MAG: small metal-binding protein SmbP [Nitrospira sp.]